MSMRSNETVPQESARQRFEQLVASIDGIVWELDLQTFQFTFVSPQAERLLGYALDEWFAPGFWAAHIHPDDRNWAVEFCLRATGEKRNHDFEYRMVAADGRVVWLRDIVSVVVEGGEATRLRGIMVDITDLKHAEQERLAHLRFFESMDRVNRAIQGTDDLEQMMSDVLDAVQTIFDSDRAWLVYPCDPEASTWHVPMERTRQEYPGAFALNVDLPVTPDVAKTFETMRASSGPVRFDPESGRSLPADVTERFGIQSQIAMALYPKVDKPYMFGLHQCSRPRVWTREEERLFQEIGRRLADALTSLLMLRSLRESERRLEEAQQVAHVGYWDRDFDANRINLSDETYRIFGLKPQERILDFARWGEIWTSLVHPEDAQRVTQAMAEALRGGPRYDVEYRVIRPSGEVRIVHSQCDVTWDDAGRARRLFGTVQNVTELRQAEYELRASEARFRTFVDHATDAFFLHDEQGIILDVNSQACESLGYTREELIGMRPETFDVGAERGFLDQLPSRFDAGETIAFDSRHRRKDGTVFPVEVRIRPFWESGHRFAVSLARDITERKRAEQALVESHNLLHAVIEGTSDAVFVKNLQGRYLMINSAGARFLGKPVEEVIGKDDQDLFEPDSARSIRERDREVMATGESQTFEEPATAAGVTRTYLATKSVYRDAQGWVIGLIGIARDVTELKRLEEQFRQAQKMEAVGRLAGGVAHDFNNLLTVINGYTQMVFGTLAAADPSREMLAKVMKSGERAATLTRQLLAFSSNQILQPQVVNLNTLLRELRKLLQPLIGENIELALELDPDLGLAKVDPGQFEHAVINLVVNARDAMPEGGRLTIETRNAGLGEAYAARHPEVGQGRYVLVTVSDSGQGMDEVTRARIFEPFFTTKEPGKGTGLGLAMVYGFVKQSGGHVEVRSDSGHGSTFEVYLPRAEEAIPSAVSLPDLLGVPRGTETVLLAEDETDVRTMSALLLESSGYTVLEARNGKEAISIARQHEGPIHLLLTDLMMPGMSGRQLADLLARERPNTRILFMSGYTDEDVLRNEVLKASVAFLQKPFSSMDLARKVREVLDAEG